MSGKPHEIEVTAAMLIEAIEQRVEQVVEYLTRDDGSPIFSVALTPQEQLQRFNDPVIRGNIESKLAATLGPDAVFRYRNEMMREQSRVWNAQLNNPARGRFG